MPPVRERLAQLGETVEILRRLWSEERASFAGRYHRIESAPCLPKPAGLSLLLGGSGEGLLRLAARHADVWNSPNPAWRELPAKRARLRELCTAIGRDPETLAVSEQVMVVVGATEADVARRLDVARQALAGFAQFDGDVHVGTAEQVAGALLARRAAGVDSFMVMFGDFGSDDQIDLFAERVLPLLR
jgi:alkanesulfonate monooxygenase SsuD/methylene tetrahydromethanopterin reductase-like flavin-dependent oxidoreductase (luciferase family)